MLTLPRLMLAAPSSGSGKSVITSGLMAAFAKRLPVQGFKVGPDYIDPMYHTAATGRPSRNLDAWMLAPETVTRIFESASRAASLSLVEGVMGLFDGYDSHPLLGSSAGIAALLKTPVILVIDCSNMSGSAAAVVHGFNSFCSEIKLAGVICNRVAGAQHARWLRDAIEQGTSIPVLGCIPCLAELQLPERHLGLFTVAERVEAVADFLSRAADILASHLDLDRLYALACQAPALPESQVPAVKRPSPSARLAVARDEAFCFYYEDNLDELRRHGAQIVPFSPLTDARLPEGVSGIYLGGGYPELYTERLSQNGSLRQQILDCCRQGMPAYAECGGLMYLTEGIQTGAARRPLVGALPGWCEMGEYLTMGYREIEVVQPALLGLPGLRLRGHEFHFSRWQNPDPERALYRVCSRWGQAPDQLEGYADGQMQASYIHLHFAQNPALASRFVAQCVSWQAEAAHRQTPGSGGAHE